MGHHVQGIVFRKTLLPVAKRLIPSGKGAALGQDFCFLPITDRVYDDLRSTYPDLADAENGFERLSADHHDEFDALGLGQYRSNSSWFHKATDAR